MFEKETLFETQQLSVSGELLTLMLLVFWGVLLALEFIFPREKLSVQSLRHSYKTNISLFVFNSVVMSVLSVSSLFLLAERYARFGLLSYLDNPLWGGLLAFVAFDLLLYAWHRVCHQFDSLWMFHRVHHNEPYLNVSTAFRVHIAEACLTNLLKAIYIVVMGVDQMMVLINETIMTLFVMFHHSNLRFKAEKWLGYVFIVPYLHRAHHSAERSEHDRNYGAVLSVWDRLFGTLTKATPTTIGIHGYSPQTFFGLLTFGFAFTPALPTARKMDLDTMIAEAAYYRAEKRNFMPGYELIDWLEAKKEIIRREYGDDQSDDFGSNGRMRFQS